MMQLIDVARMLRSMSMSVSRWIADAAVWACSVVRTRWPVIAARKAIWAVSSSRISPTSSTSGSERSTVRRPVREREPGPRVDLDLIEAGGAILDRVLDRRQLALGRVEDLQAGEERRRLAGSRRPDDDDGAERLRDRMLERCPAPRPHAERRRANRVPRPARGCAVSPSRRMSSAGSRCGRRSNRCPA